MKRPSEHFVRDVMSGSARGVGPSLLRSSLRLAEPFYAGAMSVRNRLFDSGIRRIGRLPRPVISVGNITTGGTGKTPMVRWLADSVRNHGRTVAILSRGYRAGDGPGDELTMLDQSLNDPGRPPVVIRANPDRLSAAHSLLAEQPGVDVFLLDDGFQHRRVARDLDLVLVSAAEPFGFGHVLPRGLLREPPSGLQRAHALIITHADQVPAAALSNIESFLRRHNPDAPIYHAVHAQTGLHEAFSTAAAPPDHPMEELSRRPFFAFCGIGDPETFGRQLARFGPSAGRRWFADHHAYTESDLRTLNEQASAAGAAVLVTTEKDWVKIAGLPRPTGSLPIWRVALGIRFLREDESGLLDQVRHVLGK